VALNITKEAARLERMTTKELRERYEEVFGEACRSNHRRWLVKRIIWRMQAEVEGNLTERARKRALELADDADLRVTAPAKKPPEVPSSLRVVRGTVSTRHDSRIPMPGTVLAREYKGETVRVTVLPDGFEYEGEVYSSLSAVAKAITGSHTSGFLFFRLNGKGGRK
jgi:hypothetical protein